MRVLCNKLQGDQGNKLDVVSVINSKMIGEIILQKFLTQEQQRELTYQDR